MIDPASRLLSTGHSLHIQDSNSHLPNAIIFVHGLGSSTSTYSAMIEASGLGVYRRIVTYDAEGFGLSPLQKGISIDEYVEDLRALFSLLEIEKAIIVAHSMGGVSVPPFLVWPRSSTQFSSSRHASQRNSPRWWNTWVGRFPGSKHDRALFDDLW